MWDGPQITVLMPVYNGEKYLQDAINSILAQTYKNFELLIIDDGSVDNSAAIIKSINDKRIVYIKNEENLGISKSLNKGISLAKGDYIARMDCDDIALPDRLKIQYNYLLRHKKVGICGTWVRFFGKDQGVMTYPIRDKEIKAFLTFRNAFAHPSVMFKKALLIENGIWYDEHSKVEDYELWTRCAEHMELHNIPRLCLKYRIVENSLSHNIDKQKEFVKSYREVVKGIFLRNFGIELDGRELILHTSDRASLIDEGITISEMHKWLEKLQSCNKKNKRYPKLAFHAMLSYKWYEICSVYSKQGLKVFGIYFFSKYNGIIHRPWHSIILFYNCLKTKR